LLIWRTHWDSFTTTNTSTTTTTAMATTEAVEATTVAVVAAVTAAEVAVSSSTRHLRQPDHKEGAPSLLRPLMNNKKGGVKEVLEVTLARGHRRKKKEKKE